MDLQLLVSVMIFAGIVKLAGVFSIRPAVCALIVACVPYALHVLLKYIYISGYNLPLWQVFAVQDFVILILQIIFAYLVFRRLDQEDDSVGSWFISATIGALVIFLFIPSLINSVMPT